MAAALYLFLLWPLRNPHPAAQPAHGTLAIRDVKIYPSPDTAPIEHGIILVRDGIIIETGLNTTAIPGNAQILSCDHCVATAGFWNAHIHFTEPKWNLAPWKSAPALNAQLADMLTSRGFTTVVDTGSDLRVTVSLRRRIESGDLLGPKIYTAGAAVYPPNGVPYYLRDALPFYLMWFMAQPATPDEAARIAERNRANGADLLKLFTGSYIERGTVLPMPEAIARAAVAVAHPQGQLVFSHPSDLAGTKVAIESGVDVLAHAPDTTDGIDAALLARMVARHMAMIPTLKMFATTVTAKPGYLQPIYAVVRQFHMLRGELMFGTDVGYMTDYRTDDEFRALAECGLNARDILRMLTTAPAARFGVAADRGTVARGKVADLVLLDRDPDSDVTAFAHVRFTVRNGRILYEQH
jgi:imidazolonepropionase-like amidohydrolase